VRREFETKPNIDITSLICRLFTLVTDIEQMAVNAQNWGEGHGWNAEMLFSSHLPNGQERHQAVTTKHVEYYE